jgi:large subunit ribosomal protein L30
MPSQSSLKITLVKSPIGQKQRQKDTVKALGLRKMHQTVVRPDNAQMRGMVFAIQHLITVETIDEAPAESEGPKGTKE